MQANEHEHGKRQEVQVVPGVGGHPRFESEQRKIVTLYCTHYTARFTFTVSSSRTPTPVTLEIFSAHSTLSTAPYGKVDRSTQMIVHVESTGAKVRNGSSLKVCSHRRWVVGRFIVVLLLFRLRKYVGKLASHTSFRGEGEENECVTRTGGIFWCEFLVCR